MRGLVRVFTLEDVALALWLALGWPTVWFGLLLDGRAAPLGAAAAAAYMFAVLTRARDDEPRRSGWGLIATFSLAAVLTDMALGAKAGAPVVIEALLVLALVAALRHAFADGRAWLRLPNGLRRALALPLLAVAATVPAGLLAGVVEELTLDRELVGEVLPRTVYAAAVQVLLLFPCVYAFAVGLPRAAARVVPSASLAVWAGRYALMTTAAVVGVTVTAPRDMGVPVGAAATALTHRHAPVVADSKGEEDVPPRERPTGPQAAGPPSAVGPTRLLTGQLGTAHPTVVVAAPPAGHWLAICQARADTDGDGGIRVDLGRHGDTHVDALQPYLIAAPGPGEAIDAFIASDATGRHVAFVRAGLLVLRDTWRDEEVVLGVAEGEDAGPFGYDRGVSFDAAGERAAFARRTAKGLEVVVRVLATGEERRISAGLAPVHGFTLDPGGEFVFFEVLERDTDGDGEITAPVAATSLGPAACRGPVRSYGFYGHSGDEPVTRVARVVDGTTAAREPGALGVLRGELVVRREDGAIVARGEAGDRVVVPAACGGRVVHAEAGRGSLLVACGAEAVAGEGPDERRAPLRRFGRDGQVTDLDLTVQFIEHDAWQSDDGVVYASGGRRLNVATGSVGSDGGASLVDGDWTVFLHDDGAVLVDFVTGARRRLPLVFAGEVMGRHHGALHLLLAARMDGTAVFDFAHDELLGRVAGWPLGLASDGHVLVAVRAAYDAVATGPLRWAAPG